MIKIYVLIVIILACGWGYDHWGKVTLENDLNHLKKDYLNLESDFEQTMQQKMFWEKEFEKQNEKAMVSCERVCQIEERAKEEKNKDGFDWTMSLPHDGVTNQLYQD